MRQSSSVRRISVLPRLLPRLGHTEHLLVPRDVQVALVAPSLHVLAQVPKVPAHVLLVRVDVLAPRPLPPLGRDQRSAPVALDVLADAVDAVVRVRLVDLGGQVMVVVELGVYGLSELVLVSG